MSLPGRWDNAFLGRVRKIPAGFGSVPLLGVSRAEGSACPRARLRLLPAALGAVGREGRLAAWECGGFSAVIISLNAERGELGARGKPTGKADSSSSSLAMEREQAGGEGRDDNSRRILNSHAGGEGDAVFAVSCRPADPEG